MAERQKTFERDIFNVVGGFEDGPLTGRWAKFHRDIVIPTSFYMMQKTQYYAVDVPTWLGAYDVEIGRTNDEDRARLFADDAVKRAQGSGILSDRGMLERGTMSANIRQSELPRLFTTLGSYMFAKFNVAYETTGKTNFRDPVEVVSWAADIALLFSLEAVLYSLVKGFGPEEDEELSVWLAKETGFSAMATLPGLREVSSALQGYGSGGIFGAIVGKTFERPLKKAVNGDWNKSTLKSYVDAGGILFHLPSSQTNRVIDGLFEKDLSFKSDPSLMEMVGVAVGKNSLIDYFMEDIK